MSRLSIAIILALAALIWGSPAQASGDFGCTTAWKLDHAQFSGCDNMAILSPGNDTRVNLILLIGAARTQKSAALLAQDPLFGWPADFDPSTPVAPDTATTAFASGEGSRCLSNDAGIAAFIAAIGVARGISDADRAALITARKALKTSCGSSTPVAGLARAVGSATGKLFARYIAGAGAFYDGDYDTASAAFAALRTASDPWLRETAHYMLGRVELNRAQVNAFDNYGAQKDPKSIDGKVIDAADAGLRTYIRAYPNGLYTQSARGLLRRVYWLGGRVKPLAAEYSALFAQDPATRGITDDDLAQEVDNKLLPLITAADTTDPVLLAVIDLARMRRPSSDNPMTCCEKTISRDEILAQRSFFASNPALFDDLLATFAFYIDAMPGEVLRLIPDAARQSKFSYLQFSRQMLRGMALERMKDRSARGFWVEMLPGATMPYQHPALELALALHDERAGALDGIFATGSSVQLPSIRHALLMDVASPQLLRRQAANANVPTAERDVARYTLLYKDVSQGAYQAYLNDVRAFPPAPRPRAKDDADNGALQDFQNAKTGDYGCGPFVQTVTTLAKAPRDPRAGLCLAEIFRENGFGPFPINAPPKDELGGTPSLFPGSVYSRMNTYQAIIAEPKAPAADKAYALYRAINCYAPGGTSECGGKDVPLSQRKAWFARLKKDYPNSSWAQDLRYYW